MWTKRKRSKEFIRVKNRRKKCNKLSKKNISSSRSVELVVYPQSVFLRNSSGISNMDLHFRWMECPVLISQTRLFVRAERKQLLILIEYYDFLKMEVWLIFLHFRLRRGGFQWLIVTRLRALLQWEGITGRNSVKSILSHYPANYGLLFQIWASPWATELLVLYHLTVFVYSEGIHSTQEEALNYWTWYSFLYTGLQRILGILVLKRDTMIMQLWLGTELSLWYLVLRKERHFGKSKQTPTTNHSHWNTQVNSPFQISQDALLIKYSRRIFTSSAIKNPLDYSSTPWMKESGSIADLLLINT